MSRPAGSERHADMLDASPDGMTEDDVLEARLARGTAVVRSLPPCSPDRHTGTVATGPAAMASWV